MTNKTWTEDTPVVSPPFLFYRQEENGPKIAIPVLRSQHTANQGRKFASAVQATHEYGRSVYSIVIVHEDGSEGEYFPTRTPEGPVLT